MLLQTPIPADLPPGRKWLTCCVPGCTERMILTDDATRFLCGPHVNSHYAHFRAGRADQEPLDLGPDITSEDPHQSALPTPQSAIA